MFKICCDEKIPFASEAFNYIGNVTYCKGNRLTSDDLKKVDLLMIRSGTRVDSSLLEGTDVQWVATATAGTDHVDQNYLREVGIPFYHAPGCNADSVVEYVIAALFVLSKRKNTVLKDKVVGIVGAGNVGGRLVKRLEGLDMRVIVSDPPLSESDPARASQYAMEPLDTLVRESDVITLHVPLTRTGPHPTFHLFDEHRLASMKKDAWLINASRGAVVSNEALKKTLKKGQPGAVALDVWEGEPGVDVELLREVDLGTPHIAGYSYEGKVMGTIMIYQACINHFGLEDHWKYEEILGPSSEDRLDLRAPGIFPDKEESLRQLVAQMYDIEADDGRFREVFAQDVTRQAAFFQKLRKEYPRRRSFERHRLNAPGLLDAELIQRVERGLGVHVINETENTRTN